MDKTIAKLTAISRRNLPVCQLDDYHNPCMDFALWRGENCTYINLSDDVKGVEHYTPLYTVGGYKAVIFSEAIKYDKTYKVYIYAGYILSPVEYADITYRLDNKQYTHTGIAVSYKVISRTEFLFKLLVEKANNTQDMTVEATAE